jgi:hypothetical protein
VAPAEETAQGVAAKAHWHAEAVALTPEEASISLEAEMFRSVASETNTVQAIEAAVSVFSAIKSADADAQIPADTPASDSPTDHPVAEASAAKQPVGEEVDDQGSSSATFASAYQHEESEPGRDSGVNDGATGEQAEVYASSDHDQDHTGDEEAMSDDGKKGKTSRTGWHQIRTAVPAAKENLVEAAKNSEAAAETEDSPRAMAAAAAADGSSTTSDADPNAIASIVDSVLADLRPKIVEEIAKKLGKK